jgi:hypothetical protein
VVVQRTPASERRRAAEAIVALWTDIVRDLVLRQQGLPGSIREIGLLDETSALAARLDARSLTEFLDRLGRAGMLLAVNASPELVLDDLAIAMPEPAAAAA